MDTMKRILSEKCVPNVAITFRIYLTKQINWASSIRTGTSKLDNRSSFDRLHNGVLPQAWRCSAVVDSEHQQLNSGKVGDVMPCDTSTDIPKLQLFAPPLLNVS
jgi:hypothetical protein